MTSRDPESQTRDPNVLEAPALPNISKTTLTEVPRGVVDRVTDWYVLVTNTTHTSSISVCAQVFSHLNYR